ncbi:MAG: hypothetical protein JSR77_18350 [Planctomycetes bacterium]|nr:hypothetical protein [Planctomycetota bacterium]
MKRFIAVAMLTAISTSVPGCNNAFQGALSGASLGALGGMGIGSVFGAMGQGAAIGAIAGGIGGAIIGDQNARNSGSNCDY